MPMSWMEYLLMIEQLRQQREANKSADKLANKKPGPVVFEHDPAGAPFNEQQLQWNNGQFGVREAMGRTMSEGFAPYMNNTLQALSNPANNQYTTEFGKGLAPMANPMSGKGYLEYLMSNPQWMDKPKNLPISTIPGAPGTPGGKGGLPPTGGGGPPMAGPFNPNYTKPGAGVAGGQGRANTTGTEMPLGGDPNEQMPGPRNNKMDLPPSFVDKLMADGLTSLGPKGELILKATGAIIGFALFGPTGAVTGWKATGQGIKWINETFGGTPPGGQPNGNWTGGGPTTGIGPGAGN